MKNLSGTVNYLHSPTTKEFRNEKVVEPLTEEEINEIKEIYDKLTTQCREAYKRRTVKELSDLNIGLHRIKDIVESLTV